MQQILLRPHNHFQAKQVNIKQRECMSCSVKSYKTKNKHVVDVSCASISGVDTSALSMGRERQPPFGFLRIKETLINPD